MSFTAKIQADINDFQSNLDRAQARMDNFAKDIGEKVAKIGSTFQSIGGAISIGITAPVTAAGVAAYNMAADFEDALGATDQIFKSSASGVKDWADNLETYFGISKKEALEYSNLMGSMLVNIGNLTEQQAAKQGAKLIELAGDLTAMYGGRTQDAVRALTGALKGNNTMLDNYGMAVNDAMVKTRALELGLIKQGEEMSLSAKQAATLSLIYEQTSAAQGQAAREADGASGSMRAFRTEITNLTTELGAVLIPIITPMIAKLRDIAAGFREMPPEMQKAVVVIAGIAAALGPLLLALGSVMKLAPLVGTAFSVMTGPIGIAVAAIAGAAILIAKNWDKISDYFTNGAGAKLWASIKEAAGELWSRLSAIFGAIRDFVIGVWEKIGSNVIAEVQSAFNIVLAVIDGVIKHVTGIINVFSALLRGDFSGALQALKGIFVNIFTTIQNVVTSAVAMISQRIAGFLKLIGADGWGKSVEDFANRLTPVKSEIKQTATATDEATKSVEKQNTALKAVIPTLKETKKATKDYRAEMVDLFASWGIYEYQVESLSNRFKGFADNARKAGASIKELATISARQLGEKLSLALGQYELQGSSLKVPVGLDVTLPDELPGLTEALNRINGVAKASFEGINIELGSMLADTLSSALSSVGDALNSGESIIKAVGRSLLSSLGTILKKLGTMAIAAGVGIKAVKKALSTLNPYVAIAAGAALVAIGAAFSSGASKLGSSIGSGGYSGGGGGGIPSLSGSTTAIPEYLQGAYSDNNKVIFEISGDNLKGVLDRYDNKKMRTGGL